MDWYLLGFLAIAIPLMAVGIKKWINRQFVDALKEIRDGK